MNKNLIIILYFGLAAVAVIGLILVTIVTPSQIDKTVGWVVQLLGLASTAAVTIYLLGKQANTLEEVKTQTNGNLSALREENSSLRNQLLAVVGQAPPKDTPEPAKVD